MEFLKNFYILKNDLTREDLFEKTSTGSANDLICFTAKKPGFIPEIFLEVEEANDENVAYKKMIELLFSIEKLRGIESIISYNKLNLKREVVFVENDNIKLYIYTSGERKCVVKLSENEEEIIKNFCDIFNLKMIPTEYLSGLNTIKNVMLELKTKPADVKRITIDIEMCLLRNELSQLTLEKLRAFYLEAIEINPLLKLSNRKKLFYNFIYDILLENEEIKKINNPILTSLNGIVKEVREEIEKNLQSNNLLSKKIAKKRIRMATTFLYLKNDDWNELVNVSASTIKTSEVENLIKRMGPMVKFQRSFFDNLQNKFAAVMKQNKVGFYIEGFDFLTNTIEVTHNNEGSLQVLKSEIDINNSMESLKKLIIKTKKVAA